MMIYYLAALVDCHSINPLKTGLNEFPLFTTKRIKGYAYASVIRENIKTNICARLNDAETLRSKLPTTSLAIPEVG